MGDEAAYRAPVTLAGEHVRLEPLALQHTPALFEASRDEEIWRYLVEQPKGVADMRALVDEALEAQSRGVELPFAVVHLASGRVVGSTRLLDLTPADRKLEIGWTWYARDQWHTAVNTECKYLLLRHAFESLGCIRVLLKTDLRNERSQRAIERIGGVREGVLRRDRIVKNGYQRSSVYYSILDDEWPRVKTRLEAMLRTRSAIT